MRFNFFVLFQVLALVFGGKLVVKQLTIEIVLLVANLHFARWKWRFEKKKFGR